MNRKIQALAILVTMTFFLMSIVNISSASGKAERLFHEVIKDVGSDSGVIEVPFEVKWVSKWRWNTHMVYNDVSDSKGNFHLNYKWVNVLHTDWEMWSGDGNEWNMYVQYSQKIVNTGGDNELIAGFFSEVQTSRHIEISKSSEKVIMKDPATGEIVGSFEMTIIGHMITKMVNGELQFEISWEIMRNS